MSAFGPEAAAQFGQFALALAFAVTLYSVVSSLSGIWFKNDRLIASGRNAAIGTFVSISAAFFTLAYLFLTDAYGVSYVAKTSNRELPIYFKISSIWGGQEGSLLFWGWLLTVYAALVVFQNRKKHPAMMPYVTATLMGTSLFFTAMHLFIVNPFKLIAVQSAASGLTQLATPRDGQGLNPLLQDPMMVIHPPMLYLGFVGFVVPYAFAIGAMASRQLGDTWIRTTRRWTMVAWGFLGTGILLGGFWAYHELGWGGFWAWDPVENASFMPWLIGTAFLHSVMVQEKKGMLKVWNMVLVILAYTMSILGTTLTRSGLVESVHAFAKSDVGNYFMAFILLTLAGSLYLLFDRLSYFKSENHLESVVSRESSFLFNNLILLVACFAVFFGTLYPSISDWIVGEKVKVGAEWFNKVEIPIAIFLLFLTGVGPLLAWRKASPNSLKRNFLIPAGIALGVGVGLFVYGVRHFYAWTSLVMCAFVAVTIIREFYKGARARSRGTSENFLQAVVNLTLGNTRRYGGYVSHFAFVLLFIGWAGQAFVTHADMTLGIGETASIGRYMLRVEDLGFKQNPNYEAIRATVGLYERQRSGQHELVAYMHPEHRTYLAGERQGTTEVAIRSTMREDLYLVFSGPNEDGSKAILKAYDNPLVAWVWLGGLAMVLGTLIALLPNRKTLPGRPKAPESPGRPTGIQIKEGTDVEHAAH